MLAAAKKRAADRGIEFNLEKSDIFIPELCPVLGIPLTAGIGGGPVNSSPSIDRIDNRLGYVKGNIRVISWRANRLKSDASLDELEKIVSYLKLEMGAVA